MEERIFQVPDIKLSWKPWFAWHPVKLIDGKRVWLEKIERRICHFIFFYTEYRRPE